MGVFKKIWDFLWHSNSVWSFIVDVILIFLIVKFLLLPGLGLALHTSVPMVIVESGSMEHIKASYSKTISANICGHNFGQKANVGFDEYWQLCGLWYEDRNITKDEFSKFIFKNGFNKADVMIIKGEKNYKVGDVIVFKSNAYKTPIIHRIVSAREENGVRVYGTKGDHNSDQIIDYRDILGRPVAKGTPGAMLYNDETEIYSNQILGKAVGRIPWVGWMKLIFVNPSR